MAESITTQLKDVPGDIKKYPWTAIGIGFLFLILVLLIEVYKPGLITTPIKNLLAKVGL